LIILIIYFQLDFEHDDDDDMFTGVDIETLRQPQQHRFRKTHDVERLGPIHGNLDKRATEALKYLVEVRTLTRYLC
jgi:hypothetical protein